MNKLVHAVREHCSVAAFVVVFTTPVLALLIVVLARVLGGVGIDVLMHEPTAVGGVPGYAGFTATLGTIGWSVAIGAFVLGALLVRGVDDSVRPFLLASIVLTTYLCLDDTYMLHEDLLPALGVNEYLVYGSILVTALAYAAVFARQIRRGALVFAFLTVALLAVSIGMDVLDQAFDLPVGYFAIAFVEDGSKLMGIFAWAGFALLTCRDLVRGLHLRELLDGQAKGSVASTSVPQTRVS